MKKLSTLLVGISAAIVTFMVVTMARNPQWAYWLSEENGWLENATLVALLAGLVFYGLSRKYFKRAEYRFVWWMGLCLQAAFAFRETDNGYWVIGFSLTRPIEHFVADHLLISLIILMILVGLFFKPLKRLWNHIRQFHIPTLVTTPGIVFLIAGVGFVLLGQICGNQLRESTFFPLLSDFPQEYRVWEELFELMGALFLSIFPLNTKLKQFD